MLLGPAGRQIANKGLFIVAEGVLQYLPFGALPDPNGEALPLIVKHQITIAPSASVVAVLRQEIANRRSAEKAVAIFADPVFSANDVRVTPRTAAVVPLSAKRSGSLSGAQDFCGSGSAVTKPKKSRDWHPRVLR